MDRDETEALMASYDIPKDEWELILRLSERVATRAAFPFDDILLRIVHEIFRVEAGRPDGEGGSK